MISQLPQPPLMEMTFLKDADIRRRHVLDLQINRGEKIDKLWRIED
jgi:hypothetical protein